jgi:Protein of unknown function (DUF3551)
MRAAFLALVTSVFVLFTGFGSAFAEDYPYCIQGDDFPGGVGECIFATYAQCQAAASGRTAFCTVNRNLAANAQMIEKRPVRRRSN